MTFFIEWMADGRFGSASMTAFDPSVLVGEELRSDRLDLRMLDESVLEDMFEYSRDERLYRFFEFPPQNTKNETLAYIGRLEARMQDGMAHYWAIHERSIGKMIGSVGILEVDTRKRDCQIGYGINPAFWRQGYFGEAMILVIGHLFKNHGFHRISAVTQADNLPSIDGLKSLGFSVEGKLRDYYLDHRGQRHDAVLLSMLRHDDAATLITN